MLDKLRKGFGEGLFQSLSSFLTGIIFYTLFIFGIIEKRAFFILIILNIIATLVITAKTLRYGFLYLIGWIIGVIIAYYLGIIGPLGFIIFLILPILGFLIGLVIRISIFLLKLFILIVLGIIVLFLIGHVLINLI